MSFGGLNEKNRMTHSGSLACTSNLPTAGPVVVDVQIIDIDITSDKIRYIVCTQMINLLDGDSSPSVL